LCGLIRPAGQPKVTPAICGGQTYGKKIKQASIKKKIELLAQLKKLAYICPRMQLLPNSIKAPIGKVVVVIHPGGKQKKLSEDMVFNMEAKRHPIATVLSIGEVGVLSPPRFFKEHDIVAVEPHGYDEETSLLAFGLPDVHVISDASVLCRLGMEDDRFWPIAHDGAIIAKPVGTEDSSGIIDYQESDFTRINKCVVVDKTNHPDAQHFKKNSTILVADVATYRLEISNEYYYICEYKDVVCQI
jgi:hypothetical protein